MKEVPGESLEEYQQKILEKFYHEFLQDSQ